MRTVRFLVLAALLAVVPAGCCSCGTSTGWNFSVGRPASLSTIVPVQQMSGPLAVSGVAAEPVGSGLVGPVARPVIAAAPAPINPCDPPAATYYPAQVPGAVNRDMPPPCTMQDICDMLRDIRNRLPASAATPASQKPEALPRPMPPG